jgi:hypothetical protein
MREEKMSGTLSMEKLISNFVARYTFRGLRILSGPSGDRPGSRFTKPPPPRSC